MIGEHISDVEVDQAEAEAIAIDAGTFEALRQLTLFGDTTDDPRRAADRRRGARHHRKRLKRKLAGPTVHPVWRTLSERLEELRQAHVAGAEDSVEFLKQLLEVARQFVEAERAEADGRLDEFEVLDPDNGALTQILEEYAPPGVPVIVDQRRRGDRRHRPAHPGHRLAGEPARRPRGPPPAAARAQEQRPAAGGRAVRPGLRLHPRALLGRANGPPESS